MLTQLILVGLLSICSASSNEACVRELKVDVNFTGTYIVQHPSPDAEHCQWLCTEHPECLFFNFIADESTTGEGYKENKTGIFLCNLMSSSSGKPDAENHLAGVTSGYSLKQCCPKKKPCLSQLHKNVYFHGNTYQSLFTECPELCQQLCTKDPYCQFFTYRNENSKLKRFRYKCEFKTSLTVPSPDVEATADAVSGFSDKTEINTKFSHGCKSKLFQNTDIKEEDFMKLGAAGPEHCQALCSVIPKCTYFSFDRNAFTCHLKNNKNKMMLEHSVGYISGLPGHCCLPNDNWLKKQYNGVNFKGSDFRSELISDQNACQRACNEEDNCQFYTFFKDNYADKEKRRRCFLKRSITAPVLLSIKKLPNSFSGFTRRNC